MDNNGDWRPKNKGLTQCCGYLPGAVPRPPHTIYAGTFGGGIFKSTDRGPPGSHQPGHRALTEAQKSSGTVVQINALAVEWPNFFKIYAANQYRFIP